jgi:hypothetical protein
MTLLYGLDYLDFRDAVTNSYQELIQKTYILCRGTAKQSFPPGQEGVRDSTARIHTEGITSVAPAESLCKSHEGNTSHQGKHSRAPLVSVEMFLLGCPRIWLFKQLVGSVSYRNNPTQPLERSVNCRCVQSCRRRTRRLGRCLG